MSSKHLTNASSRTLIGILHFPCMMSHVTGAEINSERCSLEDIEQSKSVLQVTAVLNALLHARYLILIKEVYNNNNNKE